MDSPAHVPPGGRRLAALDIGSNSVRLLVAEAHPDGTYRVLDDEKRTTRLAHGLADDGRLHTEAMVETLDTLSRMKAIADGFGAERLSVIATSAVREASNRTEFLDLVRQRLGLDIEVIPGSTEGELAFASAVRHFDLKALHAVVMDLGGGSSELVFTVKGVVEAIYSLPIGAVRLTEELVRSDPLTENDFVRLKKRVREQFEEVVGEPLFGPSVMIGSGGTFMALANVSMRRRGKVFPTTGGYEMDRGEVRHILNHLRLLSLRERKAVQGLHADRADIIVAGVTVIERMMKLLRVNRVLINDRGVRDGLMLRLISEAFPPQVSPDGNGADRLAGVRQFAAACGLDQRHPEHVTRLAAQVFDQLQQPLGLPPGEKIILEAAGLLHEVGYLINYEGHHKHSYHLILHGNLRGLSPRQRELVANVARYHRRSLPKKKHESFARLTPAEQDTVRRMTALLRLAGALDRTHTQAVQGVRCDRHDDEVVLTALAEKEPEVDLWSAEEDGKFFEKVFGVKLKLKWQKPEGA